jgi:RimJ/RimL family protein N-acetyltransferase
MNILQKVSSLEKEAFKIREIAQRDKEKLIEFFLSLSDETKYILNGSGFTFQDATGYAESAFHPLTRSLIVEISGKIVGEARYVFIFPGITIMAEVGIVIHESFQGKGLGKKLLMKLIKDGIKMGVRKFQLYVDVNNKKAINLYKSVGFKANETILDGDRTLYYMTLYIPR